jgi:hypothetical protein
MYSRVNQPYRGFGGASSSSTSRRAGSLRIGERLVRRRVRDRSTFRVALWMSGRAVI